MRFRKRLRLMAKKYKLYCNPAGGKFNWERKFDLQNLPGRIEEYGRVVVTFEKYTPAKSLKQLGYYRAGILPWLEKELIADTGMNKAGWHEILKDKCGVKLPFCDGTSGYAKSHADYTEKEMAFFITKVQQWILEWFNITIPPPTVIEEYLE